MNKLIQTFFSHRNLILYGLIGVSAVVVDYGFFVVFYNLLDIQPALATALSVSIATIYAFILNVVFNYKTTDSLKKRFTSYVLVSTLGMLASVLIIKFLVSLNINPNFAKAISVPPIVIMQYLLNRTYAFKKKEEAETVIASASISKAEPKNIAVIGGGFTGLTAAYALAKLGHKVTVFEAQPTLGGLVAGFELDGLPLEKAYHFLYKTDRDIISLADEIGVGDKLHFHSSSVSMFYGGKVYPFMTPLDLLRFTPLSFFNRIRAGVVAVYLGKVTRWQKFARVSAYDWMMKWGGKEVTRVIWEPILRGKFFNYYNTIAMSYLWSRVYVRANSKDKGDVTEKLGYFEGGFQTFTNKLVERSLELGVTYNVDTKPSAIIQQDNSAIVEVAGIMHKFDACLTTTPSQVFRKLIENKDNEISKAYLDKLSAIDYLGAVMLVFTSEQKLTDYYWHNVNDLEQPFLVLLSLSALVGTEQLQGKNVYYVGAYVPHDHEYFTMSDESLTQLWHKGIRALFPNFTPEMVKNQEIFRFKNAQHIVEPGYAARIVPYQSELPNVYLANFTQIFPDDRGTNYAVAEGVKVANLIHNNLQQD